MTTIVSIFAILSAISTVIYTIITLRTLKEIRKQRETSYMPNVVLGECSHTLLIDKNFEQGSMRFEDTKTKMKYRNCYLNIYNIGLASAKDLKFKFIIDNDKFIKLATENVKDLKIEYRPNGFIVFDYSKLSSAHSLALQTNKEKDFLLPVNIENSAFKLELPDYIIDIFYFLVYKIEHNYECLLNLPEFKLEIEYKDLYNKIHSITYVLAFSIFSMTETDVIFEVLKK